MRQSSFSMSRILLSAGLISLTCIYAAMWLRTMSEPDQVTGADFMHQYAVGRIARSGDWHGIYDLDKQRAEEETVLGFPIEADQMLPFNHPPFTVPILALLAGFNYVTAFSLWGLVLIVVYGLSAWILLKVFPAGSIDQRLPVFASLILFFPAYLSIVNGQDTAILVLGGALIYLGIVRKDDRLAGLGLALTTIRPQLAAMLAIPFLFKRQKVWWWFVLFAGLVTALSILMVGQQGVRDFLSILSISAEGDGYKMNEVAMVNLIGLLMRLAPNWPAGSIRLIGWIGYGLGIPALSLSWWKSKSIETRHLGLAIVLALLLSPHLHYHDLALLLVPLCGVLITIAELKKASSVQIGLLAVGSSFLLMISFAIPSLRYIVSYLFMAILVAMVWFPNLLKSGLRSN
jgi:hypothetical protein